MLPLFRPTMLLIRVPLLLFRTTTVQILPLLAGMIGLSFLFQGPLIRLQGLAPLLMTTL